MDTKYLLTTLWLFGAVIYAGSTVALLHESRQNKPLEKLADLNILKVGTSVADASDSDNPVSNHISHQGWVEVISAVNMREGPSSSYAILKVQPAGYHLPVTGSDGNWLQVLDPETGEEGWVFDRYVDASATGESAVLPAELNPE